MDAAKAAEWAEFRETADEHNLGLYADGLVRLCVPSLRVVPKKRGNPRCRIGGVPDVPPDFTWPHASSGEPLGFVAQIDLAQVHATGVAGAEALPLDGVLSFFHGYEPSPNGQHTGNAGRVFYFADTTKLSPGTAPAGAPVLPSVPVSLDEQTEELPPFESPFYALLLADAGAEPDPMIFNGFVGEYGQAGLADEDDRPVHRLLGYADPLQSDVYAAAEGNAERVAFDAWNTIAHQRAAARWKLLLQLDSDAERGILFGDLGVLAFMIRESDLAERRFDRVWVEWQMH